MHFLFGDQSRVGPWPSGKRATARINARRHTATDASSRIHSVIGTSHPAFKSPAPAEGGFTLTITGGADAGYALLASTYLTDWQSLFNTYPLALALNVTDKYRHDTVGFFRLHLDP